MTNGAWFNNFKIGRNMQMGVPLSTDTVMPNKQEPEYEEDIELPPTDAAWLQKAIEAVESLKQEPMKQTPKMPRLHALGLEFAAARRALGLSQGDMAKMAQTSITTVIAIEKGRADAKIGVYLRMAHILKIKQLGL